MAVLQKNIRLIELQRILPNLKIRSISLHSAVMGESYYKHYIFITVHYLSICPNVCVERSSNYFELTGSLHLLSKVVIYWEKCSPNFKLQFVWRPLKIGNDHTWTTRPEQTVHRVQSVI